MSVTYMKLGSVSPQSRRVGIAESLDRNPFKFQRPHLAFSRRTSVRIVSYTALTSYPIPLREDGPAPATLRPIPKKVEGLVDDPSLHNPLQRLERLGTGWMGVILELEGVCVDYEYGDVSPRSWLQLAEEEGKSAPPVWALRKAEGMKNEQVRFFLDNKEFRSFSQWSAFLLIDDYIKLIISHRPTLFFFFFFFILPIQQIIQEVFCWTRNPTEVRRLTTRKEEILATLLGDRRPMIATGVPALLDTLCRTGAPTALVSSAPETRVESILKTSGLAPRFEVVVTGDDVYRGKPDPEGYLYAAQRMGRPPVRCVVVGSSNLSVEAAHEVGMKCVAVAGRHPVYELTAADLVVRSLGDLSFINLKKLFAMEENVMPHGDDEVDGELQMEEEDESSGRGGLATQVMDRL